MNHGFNGDVDRWEHTIHRLFCRPLASVVGFVGVVANDRLL